MGYSYGLELQGYKSVRSNDKVHLKKTKSNNNNTMKFQIQSQPQPHNSTPSPTASSQTRKKILLLSSFFFLVSISLSSFITVIIYIHQKYKHTGYGESYLTANSLASIITYFFAPYLIRKMRTRAKLLLLGCAGCYLVNMGVPSFFSALEEGHGDGMRPSGQRFFVEVLANVVGGIGSGLFWVVHGIYMAHYLRGYPANSKGKYWSLANVILSSRIAIAPLLTMLGLGLGNETIYFGLLSLIIVLALPIAIFGIQAIDLCEEEKKALVGGGEVERIGESGAEEEEENKNQGVFRSFVSFLKYFKKVALLLPTSILCGLVAGFVSSSLFHLLPQPAPNQNNDSKIAIALIFYGLGNVLGGHLSGYISDRYSIKIAGYLGNAFVILNSTAQAICLSLDHTLARASLIAFLSGLAFSYLFTLISLICTLYYSGSPSSFATNKQVTSFSYMGYQWIVAFLNNKCNMRINMTYQGLALVPLAIGAGWCLGLEYARREGQGKGDGEGDGVTGEELGVGKAGKSQEMGAGSGSGEQQEQQQK